MAHFKKEERMFLNNKWEMDPDIHALRNKAEEWAECKREKGKKKLEGEEVFMVDAARLLNQLFLERHQSKEMDDNKIEKSFKVKSYTFPHQPGLTS